MKIAIGLMALAIFGLGYRLQAMQQDYDALESKARTLEVWQGCIEMLGQKNGQATVADMEVCHDYP